MCFSLVRGKTEGTFLHIIGWHETSGERRFELSPVAGWGEGSSLIGSFGRRYRCLLIDPSRHELLIKYQARSIHSERANLKGNIIAEFLSSCSAVVLQDGTKTVRDMN